jgi:hypothetical protein
VGGEEVPKSVPSEESRLAKEVCVQSTRSSGRYDSLNKMNAKSCLSRH